VGTTSTTGQAEVLEELRSVILARTGRKHPITEGTKVFDRLPFLTDELKASHIQLLPEDPPPEKIDGVLIRKDNPDNILLSKPFVQGQVVYFNLLTTTAEINIDHKSDHFVGLLILEATRQIGMALAHIVRDDLPIDTRMSLQEFSLTFYNYIELRFPIVARAVAVRGGGSDLKQDQIGFLDVRQNGVTCLAGTSAGRLYETESRYKRIRNKTLEFNQRYADEFAAAVGRGGSAGDTETGEAS
jgi:hypothetical protein